MRSDLNLHQLLTEGGGGEVTNPDVVVPYERDPSYLEVPAVNWGEQKFVGLVAVFPSGTYLSFTVSGKFTVDWGDGSAVANYNTGATASKYFDFDAIASPPTSKGYKQVVVKITPQSGSNLTSINLNRRHGSATGASYYTTPWVDINLVASNLTVFTLGLASPAINHRMLERINILTAAITNFSYMFDGCSALEEVVSLPLGTGTSFSYMFRNCYNLQKLPSGIGINNAGNLTYMFANCYMLKDLSGVGFYGVSNMEYMFNMCVSMVNSPSTIITNSSSVAATSCFDGCVKLKNITSINLGGCTANNALQLAFNKCHQLETADVFNVNTNISFAGCNLSRAEIINIFNKLQWASKAINISDNWGTPLLTSSDRNIATSKGWTIIG